MFKILIVDDDEIIRAGLADLIDWESIGLEIHAAVSNGVEALQILKNNLIDIVITDIQMPEMNGVQLIRHICELGLKTRKIVLSAYSDFEYVKQAAIYGIENYILKPVDDNELTATLSGTVEKIKHDEAARRLMREGISVLKNNILTRWMVGTIDEYELLERSKFIGINIHAKEFQVAVITTKSDYTEALEDYVLRMYDENPVPAALSVFEDLNAYIVLLFSGDNLQQNHMEIQSLLINLANGFQQHNGIDILISVSDIVCGYRNVHDSYIKSVNLCRNAAVFGNKKVVFQQEIEALSNQRGKKNGAIVESIKQYIEKNYTSEINLNLLSQDMNMNAFYLGQIFKNETGETFTNYLNGIRIEMARKILSTCIAKSSDVARAVGYSNANYFYTVFKKITGMTPVSYNAIMMGLPKEEEDS